MSLVATITDQWSDGKRYHVVGTITLAGNYASGGVVIDFPTAGVEAQGPPSVLGIPPYLGYAFFGVIGTDITTNKLQGFSAAGTEMTNGAAFPGSLPNATIPFYAIWPQLI